MQARGSAVAGRRFAGLAHGTTSRATRDRSVTNDRVTNDRVTNDRVTNDRVTNDCFTHTAPGSVHSWASPGVYASWRREAAPVHLPTVLRDVRRLRGLSVRAAAARADVPRATWAAWEAGTSTPPAGRLDDVLRALGYDLRLARRQPEVDGEPAVRRFLRSSLTTRARRALADQLPAVLETCRTSARLLTGPAATGVWVPHVVARGPLPLPRVSGGRGLVRLRLDRDEGPPSYAWVPPPAQLVLDGHAERWPALLTAHRLLAEGVRDLAQRRLPAHRDPDEVRERADLAQTLTWGARSFFPVSGTDSRAWRLDGAASLDELLERQRLPPRHPRPE